MDYLWSKLKDELADQARQHLGVAGVVVENANPKSGADLAIPTFSFAKHLQKAPTEIAEDLGLKLEHPSIEKIESVNGYVNLWLDMAKTAPFVIEKAGKSGYGKHALAKDEVVLVEHTDPNPFKPLHIGHVYSNTIGESLARLYEAAGAEVHRVSYHGDVGPHIAKAIYGVSQLLDDGQAMQEVPEEERITILGRAYAHGAKAYRDDETARKEIDDLNRKIYEQAGDIRDTYESGKSWSFEYFDRIYQRLNTNFEKRYMESETAQRGMQLVSGHVGDVYEESDGAIVFRGEPHGLHTRVFVTSNGLPMYETKDIGLVYAKHDDYPDATKSIVVTAREQAEYFAVMLKSLELFSPDLAHKTLHIAHGEVRLPSGKMSSRSGDVITAEQLFDSVVQALDERASDSPAKEANMLAAIKYAFLKQNIGANIIFDIEESVSLEGQTGPYVQYAAVRISSILQTVSDSKPTFTDYDWQAERRLLLRLAHYPEAVAEATENLSPHIIAHYVYALARDFNRYYETISLKETEDTGLRGARRQLLSAVLNTLTEGLELLNIPVPEKM